MTTTLLWTGTLTALSSIAHGGETRGTITLLRRERIIQPDGSPILVPVISGNAFRGRLRRIGEELLRDALGYAGEISLPAFHALRSGGALTKTGREPLSGRRLAELRELVPQIGIFGCAAGGRIIDGCLQVGKVVPHLAETRHLLPEPPQGRTESGQPGPGSLEALPAFAATQIESSIRLDDAAGHSAAEVVTHQVPVTRSGQPDLAQLTDPTADDRGILMMYRTETFPAGSTFSTWLRLDRATDLEVSFFTDILDAFSRDGRLGGRSARGHGQVRADLTCTRLHTSSETGSRTPARDGRLLASQTSASSDRDGASGVPAGRGWRAHAEASRDEILIALKELS